MDDWVKEYFKLMFSESILETYRAMSIKQNHMPKMLYKYRSINPQENGTSRTIEALKANVLYSSPPVKFNDIFECPIVYDYEHLPQWLYRHAFYIITNYSQKYDADREFTYESLYQLYREINGVEDNELVKQLFEGKLLEAVLIRKNCYTIVSFSETYDNELMWAHYADFSKGFCIGYDFSNLDDNDLLSVCTLPVEYNDNQSFSFPKSEDVWGLTAMHALSTKSKAWAYEKEWRYFNIGSETGCSFKVQMPKPKAIYAGSMINFKWFSELAEYCRENSILLYRMKPDYEKHTLNPESMYFNEEIINAQ